MQKRTLGNNNLEVSALGLGCMRMSHDESPLPDKQEMIATDPVGSRTRHYLFRHRPGLRPVHQ